MTTLEVRAEIKECLWKLSEGNTYLDITREEVENAILEIIDKYAEQEPCDDTISREAVVDDFIEWREKLEYAVGEDYSGVHLLNVAIQKIWDMPSVRPQEQTGHWKRISMDRYTTHAQYWYECDKCGEHNLGNTDFCPKCGCRMVEPQESEDKE